jgi:hypothetical protein
LTGKFNGLKAPLAGRMIASPAALFICGGVL